MNRCLNCHRNIEKDTVWCPYCGTEQNPRYNLFFTFFLFIVLAALVMFGCYKYKEKEQKKKDIELYGENAKYSSSNKTTDHKLWYKVDKTTRTDTSYTVSGQVLNNGKETVNNLSIIFECYDYGTSSKVLISDHTDSIKPNSLWEFNATGSNTLENCKFKIIEIYE